MNGMWPDLVLYLCDPLRAGLCLLRQPFDSLAQAAVLLLQLAHLITKPNKKTDPVKQLPLAIDRGTT